MGNTEEVRAVLYRIALKELSFLLASCPYGMVAEKLKKFQVNGRSFYDLTCLNTPDTDYRTIMTIIDVIVDHHPRLPWLRVFRARALLPIGYYWLAIEDCQVALFYFSEYPDAYILLAEIYYVIQRYAQALEAVCMALDMSPHASRALLIRAIIYQDIALQYPEVLHRYSMLSLQDREHLSALSTGNSLYFNATLYRLKNVLNEK